MHETLLFFIIISIILLFLFYFFTLGINNPKIMLRSAKKLEWLSVVIIIIIIIILFSLFLYRSVSKF